MRVEGKTGPGPLSAALAQRGIPKAAEAKREEEPKEILLLVCSGC